MVPIVEIGMRQEAQAAADIFVNLAAGEVPEGWELIGSGKERTVYLSPTGTVYKVAGDPDVALAERDTFASIVDEGTLAEHIPPHAVHVLAVAAPAGVRTVGVTAMPYLPEDGSVARDDVRIFLLVQQTGDFNPDNVHGHKGRLYLIDGAGLPGHRDWGRR